jgi:hypothetical protein
MTGLIVALFGFAAIVGGTVAAGDGQTVALVVLGATVSAAGILEWADRGR